MLISFNMPAFESQGHKQGENAQMSEDATFRYGAALNYLLHGDTGRRVLVGDTTIVHWADGTTSSDEAHQAEALVTALGASLNPLFQTGCTTSSRSCSPNSNGPSSERPERPPKRWSPS